MSARFLVALLLGLGWHATVQACSCTRAVASVSDDEMFKRVPIIFTGKVIEIEKSTNNPSGIAVFEVETVWKGNEQKRIKVPMGSGAMCGVSFSLNAVTTVYGSKYDHLPSDTVVTGLCTMYFTKISREYLEGYKNRRDALEKENQSQPNLEAVTRFADFLWEHNDTERSLVAIGQQISLGDQRAIPPLRQAKLLFDLGRFESALESYDQAMKRQSPLPEAEKGRTAALLKLKRYADIPIDVREFSRMDLRDAKFENRLLKGANFTGATLTNATLTNSDLEKAMFGGADLRSAKLKSIRADGANFQKAIGSQADFSASNLIRANFAEAELESANLSEVAMSSADFSKTSLRLATLQGATAESANFQQAKFSGTNLRALQAPNADFSQSVFSYWRGDNNLFGTQRTLRDDVTAQFGKANLSGAKLVGADLRWVDLSQVNLTGADLSMAAFNCETRFPGGFDISEHRLLPIWTGCSSQKPKTLLFHVPFSTKPVANTGTPSPYLFPTTLELDADLSNLNFDRVIFGKADLRKTDLSDSSLVGADLRGTSLYEAKLRFADLSKAKLEGVSLNRADIKFAKFKGATYNAQTTWPENFDPKDAGAILATLPSLATDKKAQTGVRKRK